MGLTCHLALAFDPADEARMISFYNGDDDGDDRNPVRHQADFDLEREIYYEVHRVLEALAIDDPELAALGTIVIGTRPVAEGGMGIQYLYAAETVRRMADAYRQVTPEALAVAIETVRPDIDPELFAQVSDYIAEKFDIARRELSFAADNGWAMLAGMI